MNITESVYFLFFLLATVVGIVLVSVQTVLSLGTGVNIAVYALVVAALVFMQLACRKKDERPVAFEFETKQKLNLYSFLAAGGFIAEMVCNLLGIYGAFENGTAAFGSVIIMAFTAVFALLSAFAFVLVGMSYGNTNHDFRRLPYVVFAPLAWSMLRIAQSLTEYVSVGRDLLPALKMTALVFLMLFFYRFAFEAVKNEPTAKSTLFFSGAVFFMGVLYCVSYTASLNSRQADANTFDCGLALTALAVSYFAIKFRRSIIDRC